MSNRPKDDADATARKERAARLHETIERKGGRPGAPPPPSSPHEFAEREKNKAVDPSEEEVDGDESAEK